jgi:predicted kinase
MIRLDDLRAEFGAREDQANNGQVLQMARERLRNSLRHGEKVVWDATNLRRDFRDRIIQLAYDYGALVTMVIVHARALDYAVGNRRRSEAVPESVLRDQLETMQWPELSEAHRTVVLGRDHRVLAYFGGTGEGLPYNLAAPAHGFMSDSRGSLGLCIEVEGVPCVEPPRAMRR